MLVITSSSSKMLCLLFVMSFLYSFTSTILVLYCSHIYNYTLAYQACSFLLLDPTIRTVVTPIVKQLWFLVKPHHQFIACF